MIHVALRQFADVLPQQKDAGKDVVFHAGTTPYLPTVVGVNKILFTGCWFVSLASEKTS